jgi:hypothetical protein
MTTKLQVMLRTFLAIVIAGLVVMAGGSYLIWIGHTAPQLLLGFFTLLAGGRIAWAGAKCGEEELAAAKAAALKKAIQEIGSKPGAP